MSTSNSTIALATELQPEEFPPQSQLRSYILAFQFSSWYGNESLAALSIKSTIIRPLPRAVREYLDSDAGLFVPDGAEDVPAESTLSDEDDEDDSDHESDSASANRPQFAFPELDAQIRACVKEYGAVFPKLNFSAPKDAAWVLNPSEPLKCTSPADVYSALKASDFCMHDISPAHVFGSADCGETYELELVLRKWYAVEVSRELRCFVRGNVLIGISQRDMNYYEFYNEPTTKDAVRDAMSQFWQTKIKSHWEAIRDYTFDVLLTRDLTRAHIIDFNPYAPRTDALLFSYEELRDIYIAHAVSTPVEPSASETPSVSPITPPRALPVFKVIDSRTHPAATHGAPAYMHNKVPLDVLTMSSGRDIAQFSDEWYREIHESAIAQANVHGGNG